MVRASHGGQNEDKPLLRCGQNLRGPFLRATLQMTVGSCSRAMAIHGRQKRSYLHNRGEFLYNYCTFESMHDGDQGVVRIFVSWEV